MVRAFFAIPINESAAVNLLKSTACLRRMLDGKIRRWTPVEKWHVTLQFFEAVEPELLLRLSKAANQLAAQTTSFSLKISKIAVFPGPSSKIIAAHVVPDQVLRTLHKALEQLGKRVGLTPEGRRYRPHITLAQFNSRSFRFEPLLYSELTLPVSELVLYESQLLPEGSAYIPLRRFALQPGD